LQARWISFGGGSERSEIGKTPVEISGATNVVGVIGKDYKEECTVICSVVGSYSFSSVLEAD
jgi:hypothetical protein